ADFGRLRGNREIRENPDPDAALTLHLASDRATSGFDLAGSNAVRLESLQAVAAEVQVGATLGSAVNAALKLLTELCALWLQHRSSPKFLCLGVLAAAVSAGLLLIALDSPTLRSHRIVLEDLALEHPDLDAAGAVSGVSLSRAVVDVRTQGVQRNAALAVPLHAGDFRTAQATRAVDTDALGAQTHSRLNGTLHGATECHTALELLRDRLSDQLGIDLRLTNLDDVEVRLGLRHLGELLAKLLD